MMPKLPRVFATLGFFVKLVVLLSCCSCWPSRHLRVLAAASAADQYEADQTDSHHTLDHDERPSPTVTLPQDGRPSDVLFAVYFIPLEGNERKSLDFYVENLPLTCSFLEQFGHGIAAAGNHSFVRSIPGCEKLEPEGPDYASQDLRHDEAASLPVQNKCLFQKKTKNRREIPMDARVVQIWLNKMEILCDLGDRYPDRRIILVDAALSNGRRPFVEPMLKHFESDEQKRDSTLTMATYNPLWIKRGRNYNGWGRRTCPDLPPFVGSLLSIRGEHSHRLRSLYREALQNTSQLALQANATGTGCPCYAEEDVFAQMYKYHPMQFTVMETMEDFTPGAVRAPGDHPPIMEWQEHKRQWQRHKRQKPEKKKTRQRDEL